MYILFLVECNIQCMKIDTNLVHKLINSQFPKWSNLSIIPVKRSGWDNRTFRLGTDLLVRMPSAESYSAQVHKEQRWLPYLGEWLSIPIPKVIAFGMPEHGYPWSWSVYQWIEGEDVESSSNIDSIGLAKSIAQFVGELHELESSNGPIAGSHNFFRCLLYTSPSPRDRTRYRMPSSA